MRNVIGSILSFIDWLLVRIVDPLIPLFALGVVTASIATCAWFAHENTRLKRELSLEHARLIAALSYDQAAAPSDCIFTEHQKMMLRLWEAEREWLRKEAAKR